MIAPVNHLPGDLQIASSALFHEIIGHVQFWQPTSQAELNHGI